MNKEPRRESSGIEKREDSEEKDYPCVYFPNIICPIRTMWKLKPESLAPFCQACKDIYISRKLAKS